MTVVNRLIVIVIGLQPTKTRAEFRVRLVDGLIFETNILRVSVSPAKNDARAGHF